MSVAQQYTYGKFMWPVKKVCRSLYKLPDAAIKQKYVRWITASFRITTWHNRS